MAAQLRKSWVQPEWACLFCKEKLTQIQIEVESLRLKEPATFLKVLGKIFKTDVIWKHKNVYLMSDTFVEILDLNTFNFFIGSVDLQMN